MLKLTFLGRVANRWRIRVDLPPGLQPRGLTVGLWREDGRPLAPSVVAPTGVSGAWEAELGGPCNLPAGAELRCIADIDGGEPLVVTLGVDLRRGLHAFLHADQRLRGEPTPKPSAVTPSELDRLAHAFPWVCPTKPDACEAGGRLRDESADVPAGAPSDLLDMLKNDFGVDLDDVDEELLAHMRGGGAD
jgi:hypothetical protein